LETHTLRRSQILADFIERIKSEIVSDNHAPVNYDVSLRLVSMATELATAMVHPQSVKEQPFMAA
jgi:hypothetical protein